MLTLCDLLKTHTFHLFSVQVLIASQSVINHKNHKRKCLTQESTTKSSGSETVWVPPLYLLNSLSARRHARLGLLSAIVAGLRLLGVPGIPACTAPLNLHHPLPGCFWAAMFPLSFGSPTQGYRTVLCRFLPQHMADPVPSPPSHLVTDILCCCHL